ncbi:LysR family transcriptional regulator [Clostridium felsineum]|uniref:Hydrogen peroxide-inducible genes activator n=1 Tax=Clostridium felsineum TaxID=36839 RepID=A0A1S8LIL2_9CLOT|nr:LysR family transcriptional regulator [Clostridium felsineum]URZ01635.1 Hydrogen peroxide-inducible genes activator [Clostridium felsineum]URZ05516.1 Hydrogen peroxide-inducible genes activator [Clostridium felsineum]URZ10555.1 Hydrogen peroxide-inducible genes activator [Clostridium felsineum]URZ17528.1 Hydrogen peroxide-inducible genes activator [Clostridium felsineum DSM 794]
MDIKQLKYFIGIAEEGNITRAAEKLHIAQPHLSNQLKLLEDELSVTLVKRNTRSIKLTNAGEMLLHRAKQMLELKERTIKELRDFNEGLQGTLSIGAISSAGDILLPNWIYNFHKKYKNINFHVRECDTHEILELLNNGLIEIGIIRTPLNSELYESISLPEEPMIAAASENLFWYNEPKFIDMSELQNKPLLIHRRYEKMIIEACEQSGFQPRVLGKIEDTRTILLWAKTGMGVAIIPKDWIGIIPNINLKYAQIKESRLKTKTAIVWKKGGYLSVAAKHFLEDCRYFISEV